MLSQGLFMPESFNKLSPFERFYRMLFLSFLGPFFMFIVDIIELIEVFVLMIASTCGKKAVNKFRRPFTWIIRKI